MIILINIIFTSYYSMNIVTCTSTYCGGNEMSSLSSIGVQRELVDNSKHF